MKRMRKRMFWGSHMPVLMKLVSMTTGPILECGGGIYSTPFLHWSCYPEKRRLVTYDHSPKYFDYLKQYARDFHEVHFVDNWDDIDLSWPWSIAFIDHDPTERRGKEVSRVVHADYVIAHDTENRNAIAQGYVKAGRLFKYSYKCRELFPHTTVWSNKHDLEGFTVKI